MPLGLKRYQQTQHSHFLTFSCYHRQPYFSSPLIRDLFLSSLEQTRHKYEFRVYGFVVMPEHIHMLVSEPRIELLATALQALKISVCRRATGGGWTHEPPFWQKRYYDRNVRDHDEFVHYLRYLHRNPVSRGLCAKAEEWPWSSFGHYATGVVGVVEIESQWTAMRRTGTEPNLRQRGEIWEVKEG